MEDIDTEKLLERKLREAVFVMAVTAIVGVLAGLIGLIIIIQELGWKVAIAIFLVMFSDNLARSFNKKGKG